MTEIADPERNCGIVLGFPFDQLFDRNCGLEPWEVKGRRPFPAIKLPRDGKPGTGNIVISGIPGSGKSTLALQWAVKCASRPENWSNAVYITLETTVEEMIAKAEPFGCTEWLRELMVEDEFDDSASPIQLAEKLRDILLNRDGDVLVSGFPHHPDSLAHPTRRVLLTSLSPRPMFREKEGQSLFVRRYNQLERLLLAARMLQEEATRTGGPNSRNWEAWRKHISRRESNNEREDIPPVLPIFVIDSLNMFGKEKLTRDEVYRLFSLFRKHERIGVFTVEAAQESPFDSTMTDVVVSLTNENEGGYLTQYFSIEKSRYFNHVGGLHPYKSVSLKRRDSGTPETFDAPPILGLDEEPRKPRTGLQVFPSLHYLGLRTKPRDDVDGTTSTASPNDGLTDKIFGIKGFARILPPLDTAEPIVAIEGPLGTFKTSFAMNFLALGLCEGQSGLLIRLSSVPLCQAGEHGMKSHTVSTGLPEFSWEKWVEDDIDRSGSWRNVAPEPKATVKRWKMSEPKDEKEENTCLIEVDFKGGMLLPEEFMDIIRNIMMRTNIKRVVFDDVGQIGVSYPLLQHSKTTGDLFLPAFVNIMRNAKAALVLIGSTTGIAAGDEQVVRACSLAMTVLSCRYCDVFGDRYVVVRGEGLMAIKSDDTQADDSVPESVPGVVRARGSRGRADAQFWVDMDCLQGLMGFETNRIFRPGVVLHVFEARSRVHQNYNAEIRTLLQSGLASWPVGAGNRVDHSDSGTAGDVVVESFGPKESTAVHDALGILGEKAPLDKTVLLTVDEFGAVFPVDDATLRRGHRQKADYWLRLNKLSGVSWSDDIYPNISKDKNGGTRLVPYYGNVLLLAYRKEMATCWEGKEEEFLNNFKTWTNFAEFIKTYDDESEGNLKNETAIPRHLRAVWFDSSADETLACLLLDAVLSGVTMVAPGSPLTQIGEWREGRRQEGGDVRQNDQWHTLAELLDMVNRSLKFRKGGKAMFSQQAVGKIVAEVDALGRLLARPDAYDLGAHDLLPPDAGVYVCWYSHLRDLVDRVPDLGDSLVVNPLPAGGFRGDWFVGAVRGSVSPALGERIIKKLCSPKEDFKRFRQGVGLPVCGDYFGNDDSLSPFKLWPGSEQSLSYIKMKILKRARWRGKLDGYQEIRGALYSTVRLLMRRQAKHAIGLKQPQDINELLRDQIGQILALLKASC